MKPLPQLARHATPRDDVVGPPRDVSLLKSKGRTFYFKLFFGGPENIRSKQASAEAGPASPKAVRRGRPVAAALDCRAQDGASSPPAVAVVVG